MLFKAAAEIVSVAESDFLHYYIHVFGVKHCFCGVDSHLISVSYNAAAEMLFKNPVCMVKAYQQITFYIVTSEIFFIVFFDIVCNFHGGVI